MAVGNLKANAVTSATYDTILQVSLRISSFVLNAFIVRRVSSTIFGLLNVRLYLLYSTGLLLSREAFRRAAFGCQVEQGGLEKAKVHQFENGKQESKRFIQKLVNLIWIGTALSLPLCFGGFLIWRYGMDPPPAEVIDQYSCGLALIICSVIVEVIAEPPYILAELQLWTKMRVVIEGVAQVTRSAVLAIGIYYWPQYPVLIYGIAYITGSIFLCFSYYCTFLNSIWKKRNQKAKAEKKDVNKEVLLITDFRNLFPSIPKGRLMPDVEKSLWGVAWTFFKQGWLKEALTEGELYLMTFFPLITLAQQGTYQVVNNLGSLAARLVFRSVETASYKYFAQMLTRGVPARYQTKGVAKEVSTVLRDLLLQLVLISLIIVSFGWSFSALVLQLYGGTKLRDEGRGLLRFQCVYVVLLALNGVTESFAFAVQNQKQLDRYNRWLIIFSLIYVSTALLSVFSFGAHGYIFSNCVNMALRITYNMRFIQRHFEGTSFDPLNALRLRRGVIIAFVIAFVCMITSEILVGPILHILIGSVLLIILIFYLRHELSGIIIIIFGIIDNTCSKIMKIGNKEERKNDALGKYKLNILNYIDNILFAKKIR